MQDKQKVTLYLPPELHRQLKIRSAVDAEPMSEIAQRAIVFYLTHGDVVEEFECSTHGRSYQVYNCPDCATAMVLKEGKMASLSSQPGVLSDEELSVSATSGVHSQPDRPDHQGEELVPCG